jgi:parallel beta-helix repeat protein
VDVQPGGTLTIGTAANPIAAGTTAQLILAYGAFGITLQNGANFIVYGSTRTPYTTASADVNAAATDVTVVTPITGWSVGDLITIDSEPVSITAIAGSNVSFTPALTLSHPLANGPVIVANVTRSAVIRSSATTTGSNTATFKSLIQNTTSFSVTFGEFAYLGTAATPGVLLDGSAGNAMGTISSSTVHDGFYGFKLSAASGNVLNSNVAFRNTNYGIYILNSDNTTVTANCSLGNSTQGIVGEGSSNGSYAFNYVYGNGTRGLGLYASSANNIEASNTVYQNTTSGLYLSGALTNNNILIANNSYLNQFALYNNTTNKNVCVECNLGYNC